MHQKLVPDHYLNLLNNPKQLLHARNSFKNKYFKEDYWKSHIKVNFIFYFKPKDLEKVISVSFIVFEGLSFDEKIKNSGNKP